MAETCSSTFEGHLPGPASRPQSRAFLRQSHIRTRASIACQRCRARRVRCNATEHGAPCTNCRYDRLDCILQQREKVSKRRKPRDALPQVDISNAVDVSLGRGDKQFANDQIDDQRLSLGQNYSNTWFRVFPSNILGLTSEQSLTFDDPILCPEQLSSVALEGIPAFINDISPHLGPDDIAYLKEKGALDIPQQGLRNELLKAYIQFVYPYLPSLDLYSFIMTIESGNSPLGRISLTLFQAIMYAGSAFVDMSYMESAGYSTRKEGQKMLFRKVRLLYEMECEPDRISLIQALLLLTFHYESPDDHKDTWYWTGIVVHEAYRLDLNQPAGEPGMMTEEIKLRKRIWWSVYMRDKMIALGMRRPMHIGEDHEIPMLDLDDFNIIPIANEVTCVPPDCTVARDMKIQQRLATMCIAKAKLCVCISRILSQQYCALNRNRGIANDRTTLMLLPREPTGAASSIKVCDDELDRWWEDLPENILSCDSLSEDKCIEIHRSLLHMIFFTAISTLHRPQALSRSTIPISPAGGAEFARSFQKVRQAASAITALAQALEEAELVKYLPLTGVTVLLPAITTHLLDQQAPEESVRLAASYGFTKCMQVLSRLKDIYVAADYTVEFVQHAVYATGNRTCPTYTGFAPGNQGVNVFSDYYNAEPPAITEELIQSERQTQSSPHIPQHEDDVGLDVDLESFLERCLDYGLLV